MSIDAYDRLERICEEVDALGRVKVSDLAADLADRQDRLELMTAENLSVTAALNLSYADLTTGQQRLFRHLGLHPGTDIDAYAAAALDEGDDDLPALASLAKACASEAYLQTAIHAVQMHGGIGFTWDNDTHLWFKRAKSSEILFGDANQHREPMMQRWKH